MINLLQTSWDKDPVKRPFFPQLIDDLNEIIFEYSIQDEAGREFWKTHFFDKSLNGPQNEVDWELFASALQKEFSYLEKDLEMVKVILGILCFLFFKFLQFLLFLKNKSSKSTRIWT